MFMNFYYDTDELAFDAKVHKAKLVSTIKPTQLNVIQEDIFLVPFYELQYSGTYFGLQKNSF
jgi:hypothetical protein